MSQNILYTFINPLSTLLFLYLLFLGCTHLGLVYSPTLPPKIDVERSYFPNGNIEYEAEFINNKLDGTSRVWLEDGTLLSISEYSNGKPHGDWKTFHPNEKLKYEITYFQKILLNASRTKNKKPFHNFQQTQFTKFMKISAN